MLGSGDYSVTVTEWGGRIVWQSTTATLESVTWGRELGEVSKATASVLLPPTMADLLEPWVHLVQVYRAGQLVWDGIIIRTETTWGRVTIEASDAGIMFSRRRVPHDRAWRQHDATQVMRTMVEDALGHRDPTNVVENIVARPSRLWVTASWSAAECMVADVVDDLVGQGLAWCISAGRLLVGPVGAEYTTAQLSDKDFGGGMTVVKDGSEVVTDALVVGKGVWGQWADLNSPLGVVQAIEDADGAVYAEECQEQARRLVQDAGTTPRRLTVPSGSRLSPDAPVRMDELVPGVQVPVASRQTGVLVSSLMQLTTVEVSVDAGGEQVSVTLEETSVTGEVPALPDPAELDHRSPYERELEGTQSRGIGSGVPEGEDGVGIPPA